MVAQQAIEAWRNAPRLTSFASFFEQTAWGLANQPDLAQPEPDMSLMQFDLECMTFWDTQSRLWGHFDHHYFASIPFRLEEECRLGASILSFGLKAWARRHAPATVYTLGAGAGTLARTLAKLGDGRFKTLCCSPTEGNRASFFSRRGSEDAFFFHGPFFELDDARYVSDPTLAPFRDGYHVLLEDTTFQMYGRNRKEQLAVIAPRVRPDGVLIQIQKLSHPSIEVYLERERQKDEQFKARYFSPVQVATKKKEILNTMAGFQVDLEATIDALRLYFDYSVITWNSGNFYTIVSSNSAHSLSELVGRMIGPALPNEYCYEQLPRTFSAAGAVPLAPALSWRTAEAV